LLVLALALGVVALLTSLLCFKLISCLRYCTQTAAATDGILVQQHLGASPFFNRSWQEFKVGFGNKSGNYWIGNERLHQLTKDGRYKLRVDVLASFNGQWYWAEYSGFGVGSEASGYALFVSGYSGNAGDAMTVDGDFANSLNSKRFRTYDRPFDRNGYCVLRLNWLGGFWYSSNTNCGYALLNQATYFYWISLPLGTRSSQYVALARSRMTLLPK